MYFKFQYLFLAQNIRNFKGCFNSEQWIAYSVLVDKIWFKIMLRVYLCKINHWKLFLFDAYYGTGLKKEIKPKLMGDVSQNQLSFPLLYYINADSNS